MKISIVERKPLDGVKKTIERMRYYRSLPKDVKEVKHTLWDTYSCCNNIIKEERRKEQADNKERQ